MLTFGMPRLVWLRALPRQSGIESGALHDEHVLASREVDVGIPRSAQDVPALVAEFVLARRAKAAGLNHWAADLLSGYKGTPATMFGSCELACELELLEFIAAVNVLPDW